MRYVTLSNERGLQPIELPADQVEWMRAVAAELDASPEIVLVALIDILAEFDYSPANESMYATNADSASPEYALDEALDTLHAVGTALTDEATDIRAWLSDLDTRVSGTARRWNEARTSVQGLLNAEAADGG